MAFTYLVESCIYTVGDLLLPWGPESDPFSFFSFFFFPSSVLGKHTITESVVTLISKSQDLGTQASPFLPQGVHTGVHMDTCMCIQWCINTVL